MSSSSSASCAVPEPARGIQARREPEADIARAERRAQAADFDERAQADPFRFRELRQAAPDEDAVLAAQRHEIRHACRAPRDRGNRADRSPPPGALEQRVGDLEDDAHAAQVMKIVAQLRIDQRGARGQRLLALVMIEHDHVDPLRLQRGDFRDRGSAAIHGDDELRRMLAHAARHAIRAQAVAFIGPQGQETCGFRAHRPQQPREQRERSHAIHIVVAIEHDALAPIDRREDALHRGGHVRQQKWIAQRLQARREKLLRLPPRRTGRGAGAIPRRSARCRVRRPSAAPRRPPSAREKSSASSVRRRLFFVPRHHVQAARDQRGPAGLVRRAEAAPGLAAEVFVEKHEILPVRIAGVARIVAETGRAGRSASGRKRCVSRRAISCATCARFIKLPEPVGNSTWKSSP